MIPRISMAKALPQPFDKQKVVAENRRARFDYFVEDRFEAGIQLAGTEVKSLRHGEGSIAESYAALEGEEVWLINSHIPEYSHGNRLNHVGLCRGAIEEVDRHRKRQFPSKAFFGHRTRRGGAECSRDQAVVHQISFAYSRMVRRRERAAEEAAAPDRARAS